MRIEELKKQQTAAVSPKPIPKSDTPVATGKPIPDTGQSAWVKLCENAPGGDPSKPVNVCLTHHERLDGNTGMALVSAAVRQIEGRADQHLMVMVPLGMQQGPGMRAYIYSKDKWAAAQKVEKIEDGSLRMIQLAYSLCHAAGCTGEVEAKPDLIAELKKAGGIVVYAINNAGTPVGFPITLAGFEQAYVGAPVDNKKYAEARKKLMEQIAARQAELAKEQAKQKK